MRYEVLVALGRQRLAQARVIDEKSSIQDTCVFDRFGGRLLKMGGCN